MIEMQDNREQFINAIANSKNTIYSICHKYYSTHEDVQDAFQTVVAEAWESFHTFKGISSFNTWLYSLAFNVIYDLKRNDICRKKYIDKYNCLHKDYYEEPTSLKLQKESYILDKCISSLNGTDQDIILLYIKGETTDRIGQLIGISGNSVRVRINRIKHKLRRYAIKMI